MLARVHCSLNLNTETGRLSARRPNLQNQPALEKDRYKVCASDTAYIDPALGQLELLCSAFPHLRKVPVPDPIG